MTGTAVWNRGGRSPVLLRWVLICDIQGTLDTQPVLLTGLAASSDQILTGFVQRWQLEVTFEEARRHLGMETQRQWSDLAIQRTTPALFGLFSLVTLLAHPEMTAANFVRHAAWYHKATPTFIDALALVRRQLWGHMLFCTSSASYDVVEVPQVLVERFTDALCYAA